MSFGPRQSPKTNEDYIHHLIRMGHESVLEHVNWTFIIAGVSRAFTHQIVRHRVGFAFSQLSQQYHDESEAEFVEPLHLEKFAAAQAAWHRCVEAAQEAYRQIRDAVVEEEATPWVGRSKPGDPSRDPLHGTQCAAKRHETKIVVTANARAVRHFLRVRGSIPGTQKCAS